MTENTNTQTQGTMSADDQAMATLLAVGIRFDFPAGSYGFMNKYTTAKSKEIWKMVCEPFKNTKHAKVYETKDPQKDRGIADCLIIEPGHPGFDFLKKYVAAREENRSTEETKQVIKLRAIYMKQLGAIDQNYWDLAILKARALSAYEQTETAKIYEAGTPIKPIKPIDLRKPSYDPHRSI